MWLTENTFSMKEKPVNQNAKSNHELTIWLRFNRCLIHVVLFTLMLHVRKMNLLTDIHVLFTPHE